MSIPVLDGVTSKTITTGRLATRVLFTGPDDGIPVLFIHGTQDPFNSMRGAGRLAALAPHGQLWLVEGGGHRDAYTLDHDAYYDRVLGFLAETL